MINSPLEAIDAAVLQLATGDRAKLLERQLLCLEEDETLAAWVEEAERRGEAYESGEMEAIDFDEAIAQARARIANRRVA